VPRTLIASDNFNRVGPALGANWAQLNPLNAGDVEIGGSDYIFNGFTAATGEGGAARWTGAGSFSNDQYASLVLDFIDDFISTAYNVGPICRASADTEGGRDFYWAAVACQAGGGGTWATSFGKIVNGVRTQFHSANVAWSVGDRIELEVEGTTVRLCKNGTPLGGSFTTTDSALSTGKPGVHAAGSSAAIRGDDWEGGDITAAGGTERHQTRRMRQAGGYH
jgi:hypothetical protein